MKRLTVLLSAMNLQDSSILDKLKIHGDALIINQVPGTAERDWAQLSCCSDSENLVGKACSDIVNLSHEARNDSENFSHEARKDTTNLSAFFKGDSKVRILDTVSKGLSLSRNLAISLIDSEFGIFCDNDIEYVNSYETIITDAFKRHPKSDLLVFFIKRPERDKPIFSKEKKMGYLSTMKVFSPEIAFRVDSIRKAGLKMDELFGAGARFGMAEENIFLFDCLRAGLIITYIPIQIARTLPNESTWFKGYTADYFINRGAGYYRMSKRFFPLLSLQFLVRKRGLYRDSMSFARAAKLMLEGKKEYKGLTDKENHCKIKRSASGDNSADSSADTKADSADRSADTKANSADRSADTKANSTLPGKNNHPRLFIIGDQFSGTGPAIATEKLISSLPKGTLYLKSHSKALRAAEIALKLCFADAAIFSGHSRQNILGMKLAAALKKPSIYIMHGAVAYENKINRVPNKAMAADEIQMMRLADRILAVSPYFCDWLKVHYSRFASKTSYLMNGIDWDLSNVTAAPAPVSERPNVIVSIGGGMPRKNIVKLCEAIEKLRQEDDTKDLKLVVAGAQGADSRRIHSYSFVEDRGILSHEDTLALLRQGRIFVQNSVFETFGLAPAEALLSGADLLLSSHCGISAVIKGLEPNDLINDPNDSDEIALKLRLLLKSGNNSRLLKSIDRGETSWKTCAWKLMRIVEKMQC